MVGGLQIGRRAERKAFLAVPALFGGYLRDEAYLPSYSSVNKSNGMFLLDLGTISYTEATENAK